MAAGVTPIEMAAEGGGPTARDRAQHRSLLHAQPRMLLDEGVTLRVEDIGHLHRRPAHAGLGFRFSRDRGRTTGAGHLQLLQRIRRGLQVAPGQVEIDRRVREVGVAEQQLDGAEVRARFQQMRRVAVAQGVRRDGLVDLGALGRESHGFPDRLGRDRFVGAPAILRAGKEIRLGPHPAVVLPQRREQRRAERHLAIRPPLPWSTRSTMR